MGKLGFYEVAVTTVARHRPPMRFRGRSFMAFALTPEPPIVTVEPLESSCQPDHRCKDLAAAVDWILGAAAVAWILGAGGRW